MTVSYTASVATCRYFGCFWKLLFRWKASIYKLIWPNMILFVCLYTVISLTYRFALDSDQRRTFEEISVFCDAYRNMIPVSFVLGFYVSIVVKRWWDQYLAIPWPDPLAVLVSVHIAGTSTKSRLMRRAVMRYANVALVMTFRLISPNVKKRFPSLKHLVDAGFLLNNELEVLLKLEQKMMHPKYWVPIVWATGIVARARKEKIIKDDFAFNAIIDQLNTFRSGCLNLYSYDWISVPLVYTQVVTLAVYSYFLATLLGAQYLDPTKDYAVSKVDLYVPFFALLEFFFLMGWLLVAESLVNPFGENDDDIEVAWIVDRNLQISYLIVDEVHEEHPKLLKDPFWDDIFPPEPPPSKNRQNTPYLGSTWEMQISRDENITRSLFTPHRSNITASQISKIVHHTHVSHFLSENRRVHEKESHAIIKSIKNRFSQPKHNIGLSNRDPGSVTEECRMSKRPRSNNLGRFDNSNNVEFMSESGLQDFQSRLILKQNKPEIRPVHSWHALLRNNQDSYSVMVKSGKTNGGNFNDVLNEPHNIRHWPDTGLERFEQSQDSHSYFISNSLLHPRSETTDRSIITRCSYYGPVSETVAASTTLYTINEEREKDQNNTTQPEENVEKQI